MLDKIKEKIFKALEDPKEVQMCETYSATFNEIIKEHEQKRKEMRERLNQMNEKQILVEIAMMLYD